MLVAFRLTMPNRSSWDGRWSGDDLLHVRVRSLRRKEDIAAAKQAILKGDFHYSWDDGWGANIHVWEPEAREARRLRRKTQGFQGYDWMINSILEHGCILTDHEEH